MYPLGKKEKEEKKKINKKRNRKQGCYFIFKSDQ